MSQALKELHDALLADRPDGTEHSAVDCQFCESEAPVEMASADDSTGGNVSEKTYTEAEYTDLSVKVSALEAQIAELTKAAKDEAIDARILEAKADLEAQVTDLQSKLDAAVLETETARTELADLNAFLESEAAASAEAAALEARRGERIAQVKEVASFPDEYLDENADRFAAMSDEAFTAALEDWKAIASKPKAKAEAADAGELVLDTAMTASRSTNTNTDTSVLRDVLALRQAGVDVRTI